MNVVIPFKIKGYRKATAITVAIRQAAAANKSVLRIKATTPNTAKTKPNTIAVLLILYSVSLLSKMISLIDTFNALN